MTRWIAFCNRIAGTLLMALGGIAGCVGVYLGTFGWLNDGPAAGLGILLVGGGFGAALAGAGWCFRLMARAHDTESPRRWWLQVLVLMAAYVLVGLAAMLTSVVEDLLR